jgi:VCBS repeat-containing protein
MSEVTNNSPEAQDDEYSIDEDTSISISVLDNDEDSDRDNLTVIRISNGSNGTVAINTDAFITNYIFGLIPVFTSASTFIYDPDENFSGSDTFSYTVSDGNGGEDTARVTIEVKPVQDPPVAIDDSADTDENTSVTISVLDNDTDPDDDVLTVADVTNGQYGTVVINDDNTITYIPDDDEFSGSDTFSYTVSDGNGGEDTGTVTIGVNPVQDPPVAVDDSADIDEEYSSITISVLDNDTDPENDDLTVTDVTNGQYGTVVINDDNTITYIPDDETFPGSDTFSYTVSDGNGGQDTARVTIKGNPVQNPPVAVDDYAKTEENTSVTISVLDNDTDPDNDDLTVTDVTNGQYGTVVINNDNTITYTPNDNFSGSDTFSYTVSDGNGGQDTARVTIEGNPVQNPPVAVNDYASVEENTSVTISVLDNDTDPDNDDLTVTDVTNGQYGTVILNNDNTITYTPNDNFSGIDALSYSDTFSYTVSDGNGGQDAANVTIEVGLYQDTTLYSMGMDDYAGNSAGTGENFQLTLAGVVDAILNAINFVII